MLQEIAVFALLAVVLFFLGRALYRMLRPKKDDGKGHGGCSGCSGCCH
ncbi:FeoB-associated Cys-rich membrane protein [Porphyromonas sp.]